MGPHNGTIVGGEGKPGQDPREAQAADSQRVTEQRGWCPLPTHRLPAQQGWCHMLLHGHFAFMLAKHHHFKRQPNKSFLTLLPPSLPTQPPSSFPWAWKGWGIFVPW